MEPIVTPGLVLKETRYKESDRIITILTPGLGVISASAQPAGFFATQNLCCCRAGICTLSGKRKVKTFSTASLPALRE